MYALVFLFDNDKLPDTDCYIKLSNALSDMGFNNITNGFYISQSHVNKVTCILTVQQLAKKFSWFKPCLLNANMFCISEDIDLKLAIDLI